MHERSPRFCSWCTRDRVPQYDIIVFGCTVWSFTTHGECGLSLSLRLRPMKTLSSIQEMTSN